jgi:hypothetical protein
MAMRGADMDGMTGAATAAPPTRRIGVARRLIGVAAAVGLGGLSSAASADSPFGGLTGTWRGSAQVKLSSGSSENLKCAAYYNPKGDGELGLAIRCASAGNKIELRAQLALEGNRVTGQWEERTYNASGQVTGHGSDGRLILTIDGGAFKGSMAVRTTGSSQTVSIRTEGIALQGVSINLSRS